MHEIDWKWCPRVAANALTRNFLLSQARLQKTRNTLEAYGLSVLPGESRGEGKKKERETRQ